jgi:predicted nucleotidyltransferase
MTLIKTVKNYGNSGGVYVPRSWVGGKAKIELVEEPIKPETDILRNISRPEHLISAILYGSYVRNEQTDKSDVDVILVVDEDAKNVKIPIELKRQKNYDIQIKTEKEIRDAMIHDPIFHKVIIDESTAILNHKFLDSLRKEKTNKADMKIRISLTESSLNIIKTLFDYNEDCKSLIYPLMLRIKEAFLMECIIKNKKYSLKSLENEALIF